METEVLINELVDKIDRIGDDYDLSYSATKDRIKDLVVRYTETICAKQRELCYGSYEYHYDGIMNETDMYNAIVCAPSVTEEPLT